MRLPAEYVTEHTHLAYATTAYGVQGATVSESHTVLGDALDASGVYVGMTRGRESNRLHVVADNLDDAREQFVLALERDRADRGLTRATAIAREAVTGLAVDGPVRLVNAAKAKLRQQIQAAEHFAQASTGAQTALYGTQAAAARRSLAEIEHLPIDQAARIIKAAEPRRQRVARLPDVTRFGRDTSGRSGPEYGLSL